VCAGLTTDFLNRKGAVIEPCDDRHRVFENEKPGIVNNTDRSLDCQIGTQLTGALLPATTLNPLSTHSADPEPDEITSKVTKTYDQNGTHGARIGVKKSEY
jgi:hypothetical protein